MKIGCLRQPGGLWHFSGSKLKENQIGPSCLGNLTMGHHMQSFDSSPSCPTSSLHRGLCYGHCHRLDLSGPALPEQMRRERDLGGRGPEGLRPGCAGGQRVQLGRKSLPHRSPHLRTGEDLHYRAYL